MRSSKVATVDVFDVSDKRTTMRSSAGRAARPLRAFVPCWVRGCVRGRGAWVRAWSRVRGCVGAWLRGCVAACLRGGLAPGAWVRARGCMGAWVQGAGRSGRVGLRRGVGAWVRPAWLPGSGPRLRGCRVPGCVGAWVQGCGGAWVGGVRGAVRGSVGAWVRGCVDAWVARCLGAVRGCVGAWVRAPGPAGRSRLAQGGRGGRDGPCRRRTRTGPRRATRSPSDCRWRRPRRISP